MLILGNEVFRADQDDYSVVHSSIENGKTRSIWGPAPEGLGASGSRALEDVVLRALALMEHEFTFERVVERWRGILEVARCDR